MAQELKTALRLSLVDEVTRATRGIRGRLDELSRAARDNNRKMRDMQGRMMGAVGAGYALYRALNSPIQSAADFQAGMSNVSTLVDTSSESMKAMGAEVLDIAKRVPVGLSDLTDALYQVRSAGVEAGEAMGVLEQSSRLAIAGLGRPEQAVDLVTSALNAFNLEGEKADQVYDNIFKTVRNGKTTIGDLSQGFGAVAGTVANANVEIDEYLAAVSAITTTGAPASQAHTQIRAAIAGLTRETRQSVAVFDQLGAKSFTDLVNKSGGMVEAFRRIREATGGDDAALLKLVGSTEAFNAIIGLTGANNEAFNETLDDMRNGTNAVDAAFEKQSQTFDNQRKIFSNNLAAMNVAIGEALLPAVNSIMEAIRPVIGAVSDFSQEFPDLTRAIVGASSALIALQVAAFGMRFAFLFFKGGVFSAAIAGLNGLDAAARSASSAVRRVRGAVVGAQMLGAVGGKAGFMASSVAAVSGFAAKIAGVVGGIVATITAITAPIWATVALVVLAVAALALAIRHYWEPISNFVSGFVGEVLDELSGLIDAIVDFGARIASAVGNWALDRVVDIATMLGFDEAAIRAAADRALTAVKAAARRMIDAVKAVPGKVGNWIRDLFEVKRYSDAAQEDFRNAGKSAARAIIDPIKALPGQIVEIMQAAADAIYDAVTAPFRKAGSYISGIGDSIRSWIPGGGGGTRQPSPFDSNRGVDGARADGGPVRAGGSYLIGEEGPEIFTPQRSGFISPNEVFSSLRSSRAPAGDRGGPAVYQTFNATFHIADGTNARELVNNVMREFGAAIRSEVESTYADAM